MIRRLALALCLLLFSSPVFADKAFFLTYTPASVHAAFTGTVGFDFTVGPRQLTITGLGRAMLTGNTGSHLLSVASGTIGGSPTTLSSATIAMTGLTVGAINYISTAPVALTPGVKYFVFSAETSGGDTFNDTDATMTETTDATLVFSAYVNVTSLTETAGTTFAGTGFKYVVRASNMMMGAGQ